MENVYHDQGLILVFAVRLNSKGQYNHFYLKLFLSSGII